MFAEARQLGLQLRHSLVPAGWIRIHGAPDDNKDLSQQRAEAVKSQLVAMGVDSARLTTKDLGDTKPLGPSTTAEGKANNRRVELVRL